MGTRMYNFKAESFNICICRESKYEVCHYSGIDAENVTLDPELPSIQNLYSAPANEPENERYFYHTDHLGSSSWITDASGAVYTEQGRSVNQHIQYLPYGENFIDQRVTGHDVRFRFTGKERDEATGFDYFGARYYNSDLSIWLSVDPLASKYPSMSPYMYTAGNPVMLVDPDGRDNKKPERFGIGKRFKNWINGDSYKNKANKFAVKNGIHSTEDKNGRIKMTKSYIYANKKTNETGVIEEDYIFSKDDIRMERRNSTTGETSYFAMDYSGFKGILILGSGLGKDGYTVGQKGKYFEVIDFNEFSNIFSPEQIELNKKNQEFELVPIILSKRTKDGKIRQGNRDTIGWTKALVKDSIKYYDSWGRGENATPVYINPEKNRW